MGVLEAIADVVLILAALLSLVAFSFLAYAGWLIWQLVKEVKGEVTTVSTAAQDSLQEAQGTVRYISESIVKPASMAAGYATAIRATIRALTQEVAKKSRP